jgi:hypothetical protein
MTQNLKKNECNFVEVSTWVKAHYAPPQIIITNTQKLHLVFSYASGHCILDYFSSFQVYVLVLDLN